MSRPRRSLALDRFRIAAVLTMIQGHSFSALLAPGALGEPAPTWYTLWHGLTAPMFLVGAGLAYGHVRGPAAREGGPPRLLRPGWLVLVGFLLQLPGGSLRAGLASDAARATSFALGPVALIGLCLAGAELARSLCSPPRFRWLGAAILAALLAAAPLVWSLPLSQELPLVPGTWLDGGRGSTFPVFPWAGFFVAGVLCAPMLHGGASTALGGVMGALLMGASLLAWKLGAPVTDLVFWHAGSLYFAFRLGACLVLLALAEALPRWSAVGRVLAPFGERSLMAYAVHLMVLYGSPWSAGLSRAMGRLSLEEVAAPSALVLGITWFACALTNGAARLSPAPQRRALAAASGTPAR